MGLARRHLLLDHGRDQRRQQLARARQTKAAEATLQLVNERMASDEPVRIVEQTGQPRRRLDGEPCARAPRLGDDRARLRRQVESRGTASRPSRDPDAIAGKSNRGIVAAVAQRRERQRQVDGRVEWEARDHVAR